MNGHNCAVWMTESTFVIMLSIHTSYKRISHISTTDYNGVESANVMRITVIPTRLRNRVDLIPMTLDRHEYSRFSSFAERTTNANNATHHVKQGQKRRESFICNYYIISQTAIIKAIIIMCIHLDINQSIHTCILLRIERPRNVC